MSGLLFESASAGQDPFSIIEPHDKSLLDGTHMTVTLRILNPDIDSIVISRGEREKEQTIMVPKGKEIICKTLPMTINKNELTITASADGKAAGSGRITIFNLSDISKQFRSSPPEFRSSPFHTEERESACLRCHNLKVGEKDMNPGDPSKSVCYPCHRQITGYKNIHGPAARWECFTCHNKDSAPVRYLLLAPEKELCFSCHDDEKTQWMAKQYMHGPTATGKCSICHDPHASSNRYWLKLAPWQLCVSCHVDMGTGRKKHNLRVFTLVDDHPTRGYRDPRNMKEKLTCTSCHNPHASVSSMLLAFDGGSIYAFCNQCHMK